jgi:hypothetical protein
MKHHNYISSVCRFLFAGALLAVLSACATTGVIQGRMSGQPVSLQYHHSFWHQNGTITATTPNGEHFSGKFIVGTSSTTGIGVGAGSGDVGLFTGSGNTSNASAVLMGNKGNSMHCGFTLAKPDAGLEGGGVGRCKLSTGEVVDATF